MEPGHKTPDDPPESVENGKRDEKKWDISQLQPSAFPTNVQRMEFGLKDLSVVLPVTHNLHQYVSQQIRETLAKPKMQTARKSFKKKPFKESQGTESSGACYQFRQSPQDGVKISGKILRFSCSECKGEAAFSPNDLLKHFQVAHQGCLPTYPCDMCNFTANDFPVLQQHRLGHRDTYVKCEICNDNVQYSLLQLTRHFSSYHSSNGHYRCEKCKFSTKDVGTFVQHIHRHSEVQYKCGKCQHVSYTKGEFQRHLLVHTGTFPFQCQFCDYGATRKDYVLKHMNAVHSDEIERKCKLKDKEDGAKTLADAKSGLKLLLKRNTAGVARDAQWRTAGFHALSGGGLLDEYGRLANPEKTLEETQQFLERTVASEKDCIQWAKARKSEQQYLSPSTPAVLKPKMESCLGSNSGFLKTGGSGSSVLMVKNKISIPPNCTTKFMGFKMVDGKRHLVLKVIPAAKLGSSPQTVAPSVEKDAKGRGPEKGMNGPICVEDVALQCSSLPVSSHSSLSQSTLPACSDSQSSINKGSSVVKELLQAENQESSSTSHTVVNDGHPISDDEQKPSSSASPTTCKVFHTTSQKAQIAHPSKAEMDQQSEHTSLVEFASNKTSPEMDKESLSSKETLLESIVVDNENNSDLNSSRQEVFSFHNYSKDRASSESSDTVKESGDQEASQLMTDVCVKDSFQSQCAKDLTGTSLTLADVLSPHSQDCKVDEEMGEIIADQLSSQGVMEKVPDSEIEVDECIATVEEDSAEPSDVLEEPEDSLFMPKITSVFSLQSEENGPQLDVNQLLEKVLETENKKASILSAQEKKELKVAAGESTVGNPCSATALGRILEEHSDAIISQQLEKERISSANQDPVKNSAATLRILQPINVTEGYKTSGPSQDSSNEPLTVSQLLNCSSPAAVQGKSKEKESGVNSHGKIKRVCLPSPKQNHLAIRKKRQRGLLLEESSGPSPKAKKPLSKKWKETEKGPADAHELCATPVPKDVERTLRLSPFSATQRIKCPRRNQPVVVLNHPDADVPEVVNVMKTINKFKGHVLKVALSQRTIDALSELNCDPLNENPSLNIHATRSRRAKPVSPVKERYILKLRLKKTSRNKYKVVKSTSDSTEKPTFSCWFCGRIFDNQEEWIGHGQRHLMEATRDWNKLF
nr:PREDICTED: zinc finger protein 518A isoform X2 [Lepisosteus oculatus]